MEQLRGVGATLLMGAALGLVLGGCARGLEHEKPPIHPIQNMDETPRYEAQEPSAFFADGAANRPPVPGTVARDSLGVDHEGPVRVARFGVTVPASQVRAYYSGKVAEGGGLTDVGESGGDFVAESPIPSTLQVLQRGRERYDIYCAPCHARTGRGNGIVTNYDGMIVPASYLDERLRNAPDGYLYDVITNGYNNMMAYRHQVPTADRWAIVAYIRVLQRAQRASAEDVPGNVRQELR